VLRLGVIGNYQIDYWLGKKSFRTPNYLLFVKNTTAQLAPIPFLMSALGISDKTILAKV
jgi:hypothetical protein